MKPDSFTNKISLRETRPIRLNNALGVCIQCHQGVIWITSAGKAEDIFLHPGERYRIDRNGLTLIESMVGESVLLLETTCDQRLNTWLRSTGNLGQKAISA